MLGPLLTLVLCARGAPLSETIYPSSVEWLTSESDLVFVGEALQRDLFPLATGHWVRSEQFHLLDVIKGPQTATDRVTVFRIGADQPKEGWLQERPSGLHFCKVGRGWPKEIEGRYTSTAPDPLPSSFFEGKPAGSNFASSYATPEIFVVNTYEEVEGRARRHVAWEDYVRRWKREFHVKNVHREPHYTFLIGAGGEVIRQQWHQVSDDHSSSVYWPLFHDRAGHPILRWPEERGRAPARFEIEGEASGHPDTVSFAVLQSRKKAFSNRSYVWTSIPEKLRGWQASTNAGGLARTMSIRITVSGHVFLAVESRGVKELEQAGWTLADIQGDLDFGYNDGKGTQMKVLSRDCRAGSTVDLPSAAWTGAVLLVPPAWL